MKRLLIATLSLVMISSAAMAATTNSNTTQPTYTEQFIQKHTQKITDAEKRLQEKQKANEDAWAKKQEQLKKDAQARQDARLKQQQEWKNKIEAQKKANEEASKARQKKLQEKKELFNKLISE